MIQNALNSKVKARTTKFITRNRDTAFIPSDVAKHTGLAKSSVANALNTLEDEDIVESERVGRSIRYTVNDTNTTELLHELFRDEIRKLDDLVTTLRDKHDVTSIVLFGSRARGTAHEHSDYDLFIITDDDIQHVLTQYEHNNDVTIDATVMNKATFQTNLDSSNPLFMSMAVGLEILHDTGYFARQFKQFVEEHEDYTYSEHGTTWNVGEAGRKALT